MHSYLVGVVLGIHFLFVAFVRDVDVSFCRNLDVLADFQRLLAGHVASTRLNLTADMSDGTELFAILAGLYFIAILVQHPYGLIDGFLE